MKKQCQYLCHVTLILLLLSTPFHFATITPAAAQSEQDYIADEVVVKLFQSGDLGGVAADFSLDPNPLGQFGTRPIYRLRILDGADPEVRAAALRADSRVIFAEPNYWEETPEGRQGMRWARGGGADEYADQWAGTKINLPLAHTVSRGAGVTVAVLDTGIDAGHPAFAGRLLPGYDFVDMDGDPSEVGTPQTHPVYGHGTHVAGLVAIAAPDAKLMPVRVLDADGKGNIWVLAEALAYAVNPDGNPNTDDGADIINLSLSTRRDTDLLETVIGLITCGDDDDSDDDDDDDSDGDDSDGDDGDDDDDDDDDSDGDDDDDDDGDDDDDSGDDDNDSDSDNEAGDDDDDDCLITNGRGVVVVAAAGNRGSAVTEYPAAEDVKGVIAVTATTVDDTLAAFANYGDWIHVGAPGSQIISPVPGGDYGVWNGTSMATPLVAGQAALIRAVHPDWEPDKVVSQIVSKAVDIGGPVPQRIDAAAALEISP